MKTFSQFKEDIDSMKATMKGFADTIVPQLKSFAKQNQKSPKELTQVRDKITSKVSSTCLLYTSDAADD